jgi:CheY-like chemotaxis protein
MKVLVIDDDEVILQSLQILLTELNCETGTANSIAGALDLIEKALLDSVDFYDLILLDIKLPTMQGDLFIKVLQNTLTPDVLNKLIIVGITSNITKPFKEKMLHSGFSDIGV